MSVDTNITLPLHVRSDHILKVVAKCVGCPSVQTVFKDRQSEPFDPDLPSSRDNPWFVDFKSKSDLVIKTAGMPGNEISFGYLCFSDIVGNNYRWEIFPETEHENGKLLKPSSRVLPVAVGLRLVKFFWRHDQVQ
jgi:hypothetical protein